MENIDFNKLLEDCLDVAKTHLKSAYNSAKPFAEHSFKQFAEDAIFLTQLRLANEIDDAELKHRLENQKIALSNVLLTIKGIGLVEAQNTVNDVISIVSNSLMGSLNFALPT